MTRRRITPDERELWEKAMKTTDRLSRPLPHFVETLPTSPARPVHVRTPLKPKPFTIGSNQPADTPAHNLAPPIDESFSKVASNMDRKNFERLKKGKKSIDGRLDLHGMTLAHAHPSLIRFVREKHAEGARLLLVITGKGRGSRDLDFMTDRRGVLKHQVPQWLSMPPLGPLVLQVVQAAPKDGGTGAYYVYLRRQR